MLFNLYFSLNSVDNVYFHKDNLELSNLSESVHLLWNIFLCIISFTLLYRNYIKDYNFYHFWDVRSEPDASELKEIIKMKKWSPPEMKKQYNSSVSPLKTDLSKLVAKNMSWIEDQTIPDLCDSSPCLSEASPSTIEIFSKNKPCKIVDFTIVKEKEARRDWMSEETDESFLRNEKAVESPSPVKAITPKIICTEDDDSGYSNSEKDRSMDSCSSSNKTVLYFNDTIEEMKSYFNPTGEKKNDSDSSSKQINQKLASIDENFETGGGRTLNFEFSKKERDGSDVALKKEQSFEQLPVQVGRNDISKEEKSFENLNIEPSEVKGSNENGTNEQCFENSIHDSTGEFESSNRESWVEPSLEGSMNFNDSLEEMEYMIKVMKNLSKPGDTKAQVKENSPKEKKIIQNDIMNVKNAKNINANQPKKEFFKDTVVKSPLCKVDNILTPRRKIDNILTPSCLRTVLTPSHSNTKVSSSSNKFDKILTPLRTNENASSPSNQVDNILSPFKLPKYPVTPATGKRRFFTSPEQAKPVTPSRYENIISPVQYYIKNSPTVPYIKNVSPGKNLWQRDCKRLEGGVKPSVNKGKENVPLQKKAYVSAKTTKLVEVSPSQRLPTSRSVAAMAASLPQPMVIRHQRRENHSKMAATSSSADSTRDSFADMTIAGTDVSVCVGKRVLRSRTLK